MGSNKKKNNSAGGSVTSDNRGKKPADGEFEETLYISLDDDDEPGGKGPNARSGGFDGDGFSFGGSGDKGDKYDADEEDGEYGPDEDEDDDSIIPPFLQPLADKCGEALDKMDRKLNRHYFHPDSRNVVSEKTTHITLIAAAALSLLIGFAVIIFLGTFHYYTTGMKTKDFIREFNAICSDTDIRAILPDYVDVTIPENARLGKEPLYLADGHVKLTVNTRFGKIIDLSVEGIDIPNYDEAHYAFLEEYNDGYDPGNGQFYYYIAIGKAAIAAEKLIDNPELNKSDGSSSSDVSDDGSEVDLEYVPTVYEAATYGYELYYYSFYYYMNRLNSGYLYLPIGKCHLDYQLSESKLSVKPTLQKITNLPEGLQSFWDRFTGKNNKTEDEADETDGSDDTVPTAAGPAGVSGSDTVSGTSAPAEPEETAEPAEPAA